MGTRRLTAAAVSATALAATLLSGGVANAGPAASARPAASATFTCPYGDLCVHLRHSDGSYTWKSFYYCEKYTLNGTATWYVNNQTPGTVAAFYYPWEVSSQAPYYSGRPPYYPYDAKHPAPQAVRPC